MNSNDHGEEDGGGDSNYGIGKMLQKDKDDDEEEVEREQERVRVREFVRRQVQDWDDQVKAVARFKGFSGQRSDWEGRYLFWRELIIKVARYLGTFVIHPSRLHNIWFRREDALSPLCLHQVLFEMYNAGDLLRESDLVDPTRTTTATGRRLSLILWKAVRALGLSSTPDNYLPEDYYILSALLKDKALEVVKLLSHSHWTSSCVITLRKFQEICGGPKEASALLSYLSGCRKAKYLMISKNDAVEDSRRCLYLIPLFPNGESMNHGVKVSLSTAAVSDVTSLDYDVLHLIWTVENLELQLDVIDQRCQKFKRSAVAYLKSGNRKLAVRHARELKLAFQSREKCTALLNRVEEVLRVIGDAESSRKVSEAIALGAQAMRENRISIEEVELCLHDLNMSINSIKQVDEVLGSTPALAVIEDEDIEEELNMLEIEIRSGSSHEPNVKLGIGSSAVAAEASETVDSLSHSLSNLNIKDSATTKTAKNYVYE